MLLWLRLTGATAPSPPAWPPSTSSTHLHSCDHSGETALLLHNVKTLSSSLTLNLQHRLRCLTLLLITSQCAGFPPPWGTSYQPKLSQPAVWYETGLFVSDHGGGEAAWHTHLSKRRVSVEVHGVAFSWSVSATNHLLKDSTSVSIWIWVTLYETKEKSLLTEVRIHLEYV